MPGSHTANYPALVDELLKEESWLQPLHSRLDTALYYCLTAGRSNITQQRTVAYLWHQQSRSAIPCCDLSGTGHKKLSGLNTPQLCTLLERATDFAISARRNYKRQDFTILVGIVSVELTKRSRNMNGGTMSATIKPSH
jgi:hypothetical protein